MKALGWLVCVIVALFTCSPAQAQASKLTQAKALFRAGNRAYSAGEFEAAAKAFEQAYELVAKPALRFSAAQAYRRRYAADSNPAHLRRALRYFREYLKVATKGKRRVDAAEAINQIQLLLREHAPPPPPADGTDPPPPVVAPKVVDSTKLMVDSPTPGVKVSLNGKPPEGVPLIVDVTAGSHRVKVEAPGFATVERQVTAVRGRLTAHDIPLTEVPAKLDVKADDGADVLIDGKPWGRAPLPAPIELASGAHRIVIGRSGHRVFVRDLTLERGSEQKVHADLVFTAQRWAAWALIGGGVASTGVGIGFAIAASSRQASAKEITDTAEAQNRDLIPAEAERYNSHISTRDDLRRVVGVALGVGVLSGGIGLLLYALDTPNLYEVAARPQTKKEGKPKPDSLDISALQTLDTHIQVGPAGGFAMLRVRF